MALTGQLDQVLTYGKKNISDFPPIGKMAIFVTEFVICLKTSKYKNELEENGFRKEELILGRGHFFLRKGVFGLIQTPTHPCKE